MSVKAWTVGLLGSVLLHGAGLAAIGLTTEPEEMPDQPIPESSFTIEAAEVPRSRAAPETPQGETAQQAKAQSTAAQSGSVPQTRAEPATPRAATLTASAAPVTALSPSLAPATPAAAPSPATAETLTASAAAASVVTAAPTQAASLSASAAQPAQIAAVQPAPTVTPATAPPAAAQPTVTPATQPAPATAPDAAPLDAAPLPATKGKATLAWAGEDAGTIPAKSLAAFAAFTQEGDLSAASAQVRDGIEGILAAVPCARLQTTFLPETGQLELRGHIPEDALRGPVLAALRAQVGDAIPLSDQLLILPRPQCGALTGIADLGLPQSNEQLDNPKVIGADGFARNTTYLEGDKFYLEMTGADYDAYLYVDYFDKDGNVIHLQPNEFVPLEQTPADAAVLVAKSDGDKPALDLTIGPPFGQEIAAAFAASVPLYQGTRPLTEPADAYLAFLKERVAQTRAENPDFKGEWVYFFITTRPR